MLSRERWREALDDVAETYDRFRPGYPAQLPADVAALAALPASGRILEIGCGTGQLTTAFADRGHQIVALEPGRALASLARRNCTPFPRVRIEVATLEEWAAEDTPFDLVLAAQSFHLVDPERRFGAAASHLASKGALAVVWNYRLPGASDAHRVLEAAYARFAPHLSPHQLSQDTPFEDEIDRSGLFGSVYMRKYLWSHTYTTAAYVGLLESLATHHVLASRTALFQAVAEGLAGTGDHIVIDYVTRLYVATRLNGPNDR